MIILTCIILLLVVIISILSYSIMKIIKNTSYLSDKEKDMIKFSIDMYVDYGEEIGITDEKQHPIIIDELGKIKDKLWVK